MKEGKKWNQDRSCEGMSENLKIIKVCWSKTIRERK